MRVSTKFQKGSPSRDRFKFMHKHMLPDTAWALDLDLVLVEKIPIPFIVAVLDFKMPGDLVGFSEAISYQWLLSLPAPHTVPVYVIEANQNFRDENSLPENDRLTVKRVVSSNYRPNPPDTKYETIAINLGWREFSNWEMELRKRRRTEMQAVIGPQPVSIDEYIRQGAGYAKSNS